MTSKLKKDNDRKPWFSLLLLSLCFYSSMLLLTVFAKNIHNTRLPQVTAARPGKQDFTYTITVEDFTDTRIGSFTALPKAMVDENKVFIVRTVEEEDFTYYYAKQIFVSIDTSKENAEFYAVSDGIDISDIVISSGYEALIDGDEIYLIQEKRKKTEDIRTENLFQ